MMYGFDVGLGWGQREDWINQTMTRALNMEVYAYVYEDRETLSEITRWTHDYDKMTFMDQETGKFSISTKGNGLLCRE